MKGLYCLKHPLPNLLLGINHLEIMLNSVPILNAKDTFFFLNPPEVSLLSLRCRSLDRILRPNFPLVKVEMMPQILTRLQHFEEKGLNFQGPVSKRSLEKFGLVFILGVYFGFSNTLKFVTQKVQRCFIMNNIFHIFWFSFQELLETAASNLFTT